jgi:hypothetical protein
MEIDSETKARITETKARIDAEIKAQRGFREVVNELISALRPPPPPPDIDRRGF